MYNESDEWFGLDGSDDPYDNDADCINDNDERYEQVE